MVTSKSGIDLIKLFEGLRLKAYKPVKTEKYYTIGYGHYGADVKEGQIISEKDAENLLIADLKKFEEYVNRYVERYNLNQNQFDALVSFTYNCGQGNLDRLVDNGKRTINEIKHKMLQYNKSNGVVLNGLTVRRKKELKLFSKPVNSNIIINKVSDDKYTTGTYTITARALKVREGAGTNYNQVPKRKLTKDGKLHSNINGSLLRNTRVTVSRVIKENDSTYWGKIPSGFIALEYKGEQYVRKE